MERITHPYRIHTAYNPVIITLSGKENTTEYFHIKAITNSNKNKVDFEVDFDEEGKATIDIQGLLKSLFGNNISLIAHNSVADDYLSVEYQIYDANETPLSENTYVLTRAVAQVGETQDLWTLRGKLLTGFDKLIVYDGYPIDVSLLAVGGKWRGYDFVPNRVTCLKIDTNDCGMPFKIETCTAEWSFSIDEAGARDFVCQEIITTGSPNVNTGNALSFVLIYKSYINGVEENSITYDLLDAFDTFPRIREYEYSPYTDEQVRIRANAFIDYIGKCNNFQVLNNVIKRDVSSCPVPFLRITDGTNEITELDVSPCQLSNTNIVIESSERWDGTSNQNFVTINPTGEFGNTDVIVTTQANGDTSRQATLTFVLLWHSISKTLTIHQSACTPPPQRTDNYLTWNAISGQNYSVEIYGEFDFAVASNVVVSFIVRYNNDGGIRELNAELVFTAGSQFSNSAVVTSSDFESATSIEVILNHFDLYIDDTYHYVANNTDVTIR